MCYTYDRWGIGLGYFSTQVTEHANKVAKDSISSLSGLATKTKFNKFDMYARDFLIRAIYYPETIDRVKEVTDRCGLCDQIGHRSTNQKFHPKI